MRACVSFCGAVALCVVKRNNKVKGNASDVFMLWCEKGGNDGVFYVLNLKGGDRRVFLRI